jgi:hypothetical protein
MDADRASISRLDSEIACMRAFMRLSPEQEATPNPGLEPPRSQRGDPPGSEGSSSSDLDHVIARLKEYVPLTTMARALPHRRRGRKCSPVTLFRWTTVGLRGVKLKYINIGSTRCTTWAWMQEFFDQVTIASGGQAHPRDDVTDSSLTN